MRDMRKKKLWLLAVPVFISILAQTGCSGPDARVPILLLARQENFGTYIGEILKAEGFNEFTVDSISSGKINGSYLDQFNLVVLADQESDHGFSDAIREYAGRGGSVIAVEPVDRLRDIFGIGTDNGTENYTFLAIDTASVTGSSLTGKLIQMHVPCLKFSAGKGEAVAWFCKDLKHDPTFPAVVKYKYGKGHTAAFLYNLQENIVLTRQGNPLSAGLEKDGIPGLRAMDLFTDGWVESSDNRINQADQQMSLLSGLIEEMASYTGPLPRLWYFPDSLKCLVTLTNDGEFRGEKDFDIQFRDVDSLGAAMSLYVLQTEKVTRTWARDWTSRGFEISGHPDATAFANSPSWHIMDSVQTAKQNEIFGLYGLKMNTVVNHWFVWCGNDATGKPEFAAQAEIEAGHGISMDINYAHYDNNSSRGHFLGPLGTDQGNFTGSGLPMRFAASTGKIIDIFQHLNNVYDQQYTENHDPEGFFQCFRGLMDRSLNDGIFSFISIKAHNDEYYFSKVPLLRMLAYARSKGVPVWTADHLLNFLRAKDEAAFSGINWQRDRLSFMFGASARTGSDLTFMVPRTFNNKAIRQISIDGKIAYVVIREIRGISYAMCTVHSGKNYSVLVTYGG